MLTPTDYEAPEAYLDAGFGFRVWLLLQLGLSRFPFIYWLLHDGIFKIYIYIYIYIHTYTYIGVCKRLVLKKFIFEAFRALGIGIFQGLGLQGVELYCFGSGGFRKSIGKGFAALV